MIWTEACGFSLERVLPRHLGCARREQQEFREVAIQIREGSDLLAAEGCRDVRPVRLQKQSRRLHDQRFSDGARLQHKLHARLGVEGDLDRWGVCRLEAGAHGRDTIHAGQQPILAEEAGGIGNRGISGVPLDTGNRDDHVRNSRPR
jgi:hypothetical protein